MSGRWRGRRRGRGAGQLIFRHYGEEAAVVNVVEERGVTASALDVEKVPGVAGGS